MKTPLSPLWFTSRVREAGERWWKEYTGAPHPFASRSRHAGRRRGGTKGAEARGGRLKMRGPRLRGAGEGRGSRKRVRVRKLERDARPCYRVTFRTGVGGGVSWGRRGAPLGLRPPQRPPDTPFLDGNGGTGARFRKRLALETITNIFHLNKLIKKMLFFLHF